jgi:hypothetical protein
MLQVANVPEEQFEVENKQPASVRQLAEVGKKAPELPPHRNEYLDWAHALSHAARCSRDSVMRSLRHGRVDDKPTPTSQGIDKNLAYGTGSAASRPRPSWRGRPLAFGSTGAAQRSM